MIYEDCESILLPKDHEKQNSMSLIQANVKNILVAVIAIN